MFYDRAVLAGVVAWALVFAVWSIMMFVPGLQDVVFLQWVIHYILLFFIVQTSVSLYQKGKKGKVDGWSLGLVMLLTGIVLDAIITMPLFVAPQGMAYADFFLNPFMLLGYIVFVVLVKHHAEK